MEISLTKILYTLNITTIFLAFAALTRKKYTYSIGTRRVLLLYTIHVVMYLRIAVGRIQIEFRIGNYRKISLYTCKIGKK